MKLFLCPLMTSLVLQLPLIADTGVRGGRLAPVFFSRIKAPSDGYLLRGAPGRPEFHPTGIVADGLRVRFLAANPAPTVETIGTGAPVHHLSPDNVRQGREQQEAITAIRYLDVYPGVTVAFRPEGASVKVEVLLPPHTDPGIFALAFDGAAKLRTGEAGEVTVEGERGELRLTGPAASQHNGGEIRRIPASFRISGVNTILALEVGAFAASEPLAATFTINFSSYFGGTGVDTASAITTDAAGNVYLAGWTDSVDLPVTAGAVRAAGRGVEAFVAKFDPTGSTLLYCTYFGGSGDDRAFGIAVDASGSVYLTGWTTSADLPTSSTAAQRKRGGYRNAFVAKLSAGGNSLTYSTYLGGSGEDAGRGVAVDSSGSAYITGDTTSRDFPVYGALQSSLKGAQDTFVAKLDGNGTKLLFSSYLGGSGTERVRAIAVDSTKAAYVAGSTDSTDFPTRNAAQPASRGNQDAFLARIDTANRSLIFSTYLGGSGGVVGYPEEAVALDVDRANNVYVAGTTSSTDFPLRNAYQTGLRGSMDAFLAAFQPSGGLTYSSYLGGGSIDVANAVRLDPSGGACLAGYTASSDFPVVSPVQTKLGGGYDGFVSCFVPSGASLSFSTLLGGSDSDTVQGIAFSGAVLNLAGQTLSGNFPLARAIQTWNAGGASAFAAQLRLPGAPAIVAVTPNAGTGASQIFTVQIADAAGYQNIAGLQVVINSALTDVRSCHVVYAASRNGFSLVDDTGSSILGPLPPGSPGALQNSQCRLDVGTSSVAGSGSTLTIRLALSFQPAYSGARNLFLEAWNSSGLEAAWQLAGTWTVPGASPPAIVSTTPSSGSGASQTFTIQLSDAAGYQNIAGLQLVINPNLTDLRSCHVVYVAASGFRLIDDTGSSILGPLPPGSAGSLQNSQCRLDGATSSVTGAGNTLTVRLALSFQPAYSGPKNLFLEAWNNFGLEAPWRLAGTWTVPGASPPVIVSTTPTSGTGSSQTFTIQLSDAAGYQNIAGLQLVVNTTLSDFRSCHVVYVAASGFLLVDDTGSSVSGPLAPGATGSLQNSQCRLDAKTSSVTGAGNTLTVRLAFTFLPAYAGARNLFLEAWNSAGLEAPWQFAGAWTVPGASPPVIVSTTPNSGTGASQTFTVQVSDPAGYQNIAGLQLVINSALTDVRSCHVAYSASRSGFFLIDDSGSSLLGPLAPGAAGALQNSQCRVNAAASSVTGSGTTLTVRFSMTFQPAYAGAQNLFLEASNNAGLEAPWQYGGTWTVPAGGL